MMNMFKRLIGIKIADGRAAEVSRQSRSVEQDIVHLSGDGSYPIEVVGESHYRDDLELLCDPHLMQEQEFTWIFDAVLILEDDNPHDKNAVAVKIGGKKVGYLSRDMAKVYRAAISEAGHPGAVGKCRARVRGGWQRKDGPPLFGVKLDIPVGR